MIKFLKKDKSLNVSMPEPQVVHGIEIKKAPIAQYLSAMRTLEDLPLQLISELFPGKTLTEIVTECTTFTDEKLAQLFVRVMIVVPEKAIQAFSVITGIEEVRVMELTPSEGIDVITAWWALNDMTSFFASAAGLVKKLLPPISNAGSSAGSPLQPSSESAKSSS